MADKKIELTADIIGAYVSRNVIPASELPALLASVHRTLSTIEEPEPEPASPQTPAVSIKKSITPEYLICLEDGQKLKMLKRYLHTRYNLSPDQYRAKWGLPRDYPMVAPIYAAARSALAKASGLGSRVGRTNKASAKAPAKPKAKAPSKQKGNPKSNPA